MERPGPQSGRRLVCYCDDCQAAAHFFDRPEALLDGYGGTEVYQTAPARLTLEAGEHLRCMRQSPRGLLRWYAGCCRTPLANSMATPQVAFVGLHAGFFEVDATDREAVLGPVYARIQGRFAPKGLPPEASPGAGLSTIVGSIAWFTKERWAGRHRPSPFYEGSALVVEPEVLTPDQRKALQRSAGVA